MWGTHYKKSLELKWVKTIYAFVLGFKTHG